MPNGQRLGERFQGWLISFLGTIGLQAWVDSVLMQKLEWINADSYADLAAYIGKYTDYTVGGLRAKARMIGIPEGDINRLISEADPQRADDPSAFIAEQLQKAASLPAWQELNQIFGALVFDPWLASLVGGQISPTAPEIERVRQFLGTQATFEAFGSAVSSLGEIATLGQVDNMGRMFSDAKWLLGTCFTSWQSTSPIVESFILKPLQRLINYTFRETDFTRSQWQDLYALGKIPPDRLGAELARQGYSDEKIGWLLDLAERQPSRSDVVGMWRKGILGETVVADELRKQGYGQVWIDRYLRYYRKEETNEEKGAYLGTLRKAFKEQLIGEGEFRDALKQQGRSDVAIDLEIAVLKLSWQVEEKTAAKSDIRSAYMEGIIGRPEAARWLANADFSSHTIDLLLGTWDKEKAPTYRKINKAELLKAWGLGVLTQPQTFQGLIDVGYDDRGATVLMETYRRSNMQVKPPETYQLKPTDIGWAWHTEVIEEGEAIDRLIELGMTEEDADLYFETFQRLHPRIVAEEPKELRKNDILEAWGRGVLTEEETLDKLTGIGYTEEDATILMDSYALRPEALPPEPTIAALIGATRRGVITQAVLSQKLTTMGLKEEDVQFYVSYATAPLPEVTRSLSRRDITTLWVEGRHDRAWALERLLALKYSPEDAEDILWLASPDIEDTETYILWVAELITTEVAVAMWLSMGFSTEQIQAVIGAT